MFRALMSAVATFLVTSVVVFMVLIPRSMGNEQAVATQVTPPKTLIDRAAEFWWVPIALGLVVGIFGLVAAFLRRNRTE